MLRGLGLSIYLACLGLDAGVHFFETVFRPEGLLWVALGFAITFVPVVLVAVIALKLMKIDFGSLAGMLCGSMANPMALNYVNATVEGDNPAVSYATVYPLSMFIRVFCSIDLNVVFVDWFRGRFFDNAAHRKVKCSPKVLCPTFWGTLHFWGLLLFRDFVSDRETGILFQVFRNECTQFFSSDVLG